MADNGRGDATFFGPPAKWAEFRTDGNLIVYATMIPAEDVGRFLDWLLAHRPLPEVAEKMPTEDAA